MIIKVDGSVVRMECDEMILFRIVASLRERGHEVEIFHLQKNKWEKVHQEKK